MILHGDGELLRRTEQAPEMRQHFHMAVPSVAVALGAGKAGAICGLRTLDDADRLHRHRGAVRCAGGGQRAGGGKAGRRPQRCCSLPKTGRRIRWRPGGHFRRYVGPDSQNAAMHFSHSTAQSLLRRIPRASPPDPLQRRLPAARHAPRRRLPCPQPLSAGPCRSRAGSPGSRP